MSFRCQELRHLQDFSPKLEGRNNDFWISSLAGITTDGLPDRLRTQRVEDQLAKEIFTHCFFMKSSDIKADADAIIDLVGLGLRKGKIRSKDVPGVVFAFVKENGESSLQKSRADLASDDRRLSTEERVRRTAMSLEVTNLENIIFQGERDRSFWATQWQACDAEEAKKKAVVTTMVGQLATERFKRCLLTEVKCCQQAVSRFETICGQGLRSTKVRTSLGPGTFAVFFCKAGPPAPAMGLFAAQAGPPAPAAGLFAAQVSRKALPVPASSTSASSSPSTSRSSASPRPSGSSPPKRRRIDLDLDDGSGGPLLPFAGQAGAPAPLSTPAKTSEPSRSKQVHCPAPATSGKAPSAVFKDPEEQHCKQVVIIERWLAQLLPKLPLDVLSTDLVQTKLEDLLQKPRGRLQRFRFDIVRIWRKYQETARQS